MDDRAFASATTLAGEIGDRRIGCAELLDFYVALALSLGACQHKGHRPPCPQG